MTQDMFVDAVGMIDPELLENYACMENRIRLQKQRRRRASWGKLLIAAAAIVLTVSLLLASLPIVYIVNHEQINHYVTQAVDSVLFPLEGEDDENADIQKEELLLDWTEWKIAGEFFAALGAGKEGSVIDQLQAGSGGLLGELGMDLGELLQKLYEYYQKYSDLIPIEDEETEGNESTPIEDDTTDLPIEDDTTDSDLIPSESETVFEYTKTQGGYCVIGIVSHKGDTVVVPSEYQGKPVISVAPKGLQPWQLDQEVKILVLPESVTEVDALTFAGCQYLQYALMPGVIRIGAEAFAECTSLISIDAQLVQTVEKYAFRGCTSLFAIELNHCDEIGEFAFMDCTSLVLAQSTGVLKLGGAAFKGCISLREVNFDNLISLGSSTFQNCVSLERIDLSATLEGIGTSAFEGCTALTSIILPKNITSLGSNIFKGCTSLRVASLQYKMSTIPMGMFDGCTALETVNSKQEITAVLSFGFRNCRSLKNVELGALTTVESGAFRGCSGIEEIDLSVCSLKKLEDSMFYDCTDLKTIKIPNTVKSIHYNAFANCASLETIYFGGTLADWNHMNVVAKGLPDQVRVICSDGETVL